MILLRYVCAPMHTNHRPLLAHLTKKDALFAAGIGIAMLACFSSPPPSSPTPVTPTPGGAGGGGGSQVCSSYRSGSTVTGVLATGVHDITYTGGAARVLFVHKRDVDPIEDGCISEAVIEAFTPAGQCKLDLTFETVASTPKQLVLTSAVLNIDSLCPGWLDAEEGTFRSAAVTPGRLTIVEQAPDNQPFACFNVTLQPTGTVELTTSGRSPLNIDLSTLQLSGSAYSSGDTAATCPAP